MSYPADLKTAGIEMLGVGKTQPRLRYHRKFPQGQPPNHPTNDTKRWILHFKAKKLAMLKTLIPKPLSIINLQPKHPPTKRVLQARSPLNTHHLTLKATFSTSYPSPKSRIHPTHHQAKRSQPPQGEARESRALVTKHPLTLSPFRHIDLRSKQELSFQFKKFQRTPSLPLHPQRMFSIHIDSRLGLSGKQALCTYVALIR